MSGRMMETPSSRPRAINAAINDQGQAAGLRSVATGEPSVDEPGPAS